jgi:hypothetical protein
MTTRTWAAAARYFGRVLAASLFGIAASAGAWERVTTRQGEVFEGDTTSSELVLSLHGGGEVVIPRAAIESLEMAEAGTIRGRIKDGTSVSGTLKGHLEIEDGMIRRRFSGYEIERVDFDLYIDPQIRKQFNSCPIRFELDQSALITNFEEPWSSTLPARVRCRELSMDSLQSRLTQFGNSSFRKKQYNPQKSATVKFETTLRVPEGHDQLVDLTFVLSQGGKLVGRGGIRRVVDESKNVPVPVTVGISPGKIDPSGPPLMLRVQVVHQDEREEIVKGGFFWWFTIPIG